MKLLSEVLHYVISNLVCFVITTNTYMADMVSVQLPIAPLYISPDCEI